MNERDYMFLEYTFLWLGIIYLIIGIFLLIIFDYPGGVAVDILFIFFLFCIFLSAIFYTKRMEYVKEMEEEIKKLKEGLNGKINR